MRMTVAKLCNKKYGDPNETIIYISLYLYTRKSIHNPVPTQLKDVLKLLTKVTLFWLWFACSKQIK